MRSGVEQVLGRNKDTAITISDTLSSRLSAQGLTPIEASRLIKDIFNIMGDVGSLTLPALNRQLERLGWEKGIMDEFSFEQVIFLLENKGQCHHERNELKGR